MISFKYNFNQDLVELQASNWIGLEQVFVNGECVSRKLNFRPQSEHEVKLHDGKPCKFQLFIDPYSEQMVCRIYKHNNLITSLKQGKKNLTQSRLLLQSVIMLTAASGIGMLLIV